MIRGGLPSRVVAASEMAASSGTSTTGMGARPLGGLVIIGRHFRGRGPLSAAGRAGNNPIREPVWPNGAGKGWDAALPPPYSPC